MENASYGLCLTAPNTHRHFPQTKAVGRAPEGNQMRHVGQRAHCLRGRNRTFENRLGGRDAVRPRACCRQVLAEFRRRDKSGYGDSAALPTEKRGRTTQRCACTGFWLIKTGKIVHDTTLATTCFRMAFTLRWGSEAALYDDWENFYKKPCGAERRFGNNVTRRSGCNKKTGKAAVKCGQRHPFQIVFASPANFQISPVVTAP